jgi:hypothetical protein
MMRGVPSTVIGLVVPDVRNARRPASDPDRYVSRRM